MSMSSFESDCIVENTFYSSYCRFRVPKLYRFAVEGKWHKIPRRCKTNPKEIKFVHRYAPNDTVLHRMVRPPDTAGMENITSKIGHEGLIEVSEMRMLAMDAILSAYPNIASTTDYLGRTPLHLACMDLSYSCGASELLLLACPMSASMQDAFGRTPLHYLVSKNKNVSNSILEKLIMVFPKATTMCDKNGQTPLAILEESKRSTKNAYEVLEAASSCSAPLSSSDVFAQLAS